jgi:serpin B
MGNKSSTADNGFDFNLFNTLLSSDNKNVFVSTFSIKAVLMLALEGSNGKTQKEILNTLKEDPLKYLDIIKFIKKNDCFKLANSAWLHPSLNINENYLNSLKINHDAVAYPLKSVDEVNKWCSDQTNGKITHIINQINSDLRLILINAIYFKSDFEKQFKSHLTKFDKFYQTSEIMLDRPMMYQQNNFPYFETNDYQALAMHYKNQEFYCLIVLPKQFDENLAASFNMTELNNLISNLKNKNVKLYLPKFKIEYETQLNNNLQHLGIKRAFSNNAEFNTISSEPLKINTVIHKTFLEVNEVGTEAVAVTGVVMALSKPSEPITMNVNRPFYFFICHRFNDIRTVLFMGKIFDPIY